MTTETQTTPQVETPPTTPPTKVEIPPSADPSLLNQKPEENKEPSPEEKAKALANDTKANPFKLEELKFASGAQVDPVFGGKFAGLVNEFGIGRDAAAKFAALYEDAQKSASEASSKNWSDMQAKWQSETKALPEFAGDKLEKSLGQIEKVLTKYGTPELRQAFDFTGAGNNPHVLSFMAKIAAAMGEGSFVPASSPMTEADLASKIYTSHNKG